MEAAFAALRASALARWEERRGNSIPLIEVGTATCGRAAGALDIGEAFQEELRRRRVDAVVTPVGCMGFCYAEPLVVIRKPGWPAIAYGYVTPGIASRLVQDFLLGEDPGFEYMLGAIEENDLVPTIFDQPRFQHERRILLANCGQIDPEHIEDYIAKGGYRALAQALQMVPEAIIEAIGASGLRGRGGAGFPTGRKWDLCRRDPGHPKYVVCNADEGDPGAFMDRTILESDPHSVIEGMIIAAYAVGSHEGYVYVRAEYPLAVERIALALRQAEEVGLLGEDILGSGFGLEIKVMQGAGAFVCGESSALMYSLEGKRGMPRVRPPHSTEAGLWGKPTVLNNVKTFAFIPHIINSGASWFAAVGTEGSKGTAVFALAGKVVNTGLVEVPMGTTLRQLIFDVGGGVPAGKTFKAVQIGGPSGGCIPESLLDTPVDFDSLTSIGAMMGSGGLVVLDEDNCMVDAARYFLDFTQKESCGKCTPCRLGTKQMLLILERIAAGKGRPSDLEHLRALAEDVGDGSLCGLGESAPNPILTTLRYFPEEYEAHIYEGRCPALVCPELVAYWIDPERCERSCDACVASCPVEAIFTARRRVKAIDPDLCVKCGSCLAACPPQYKAVFRLSPPSLLPPTPERAE